MNRIHPFICITDFLSMEWKLRKLKMGKIILIGVGKRKQPLRYIGILMSLKRPEYHPQVMRIKKNDHLRVRHSTLGAYKPELFWDLPRPSRKATVDCRILMFIYLSVYHLSIYLFIYHPFISISTSLPLFFYPSLPLSSFFLYIFLLIIFLNFMQVLMYPKLASNWFYN